MKILKSLLIIALLGAIAWVLYQAIVPSGAVSYVYDFDKSSRFISQLTPNTRVNPVLDSKQEIIGAPVYFNLNTSRKFNNAKVSLKYRYNVGLEKRCVALLLKYSNFLFLY